MKIRMTAGLFVVAALMAFAYRGARAQTPHASSAPGVVRFEAHDVDAAFRGGYSVSVADFNKDGKPDVIANSLAVSELAWYENPTWTKHVIVPEMQQIVNQAMADLDGDGIPEFVTSKKAVMKNGGDPTKNFAGYPVFYSETTPPGMNRTPAYMIDGKSYNTWGDAATNLNKAGPTKAQGLYKYSTGFVLGEF